MRSQTRVEVDSCVHSILLKVIEGASSEASKTRLWLHRASVDTALGCLSLLPQCVSVEGVSEVSQPSLVIDGVCAAANGRVCFESQISLPGAPQRAHGVVREGGSKADASESGGEASMNPRSPGQMVQRP